MPGFCDARKNQEDESLPCYEQAVGAFAIQGIYMAEV
jgi:hypothetical protein